MKEVVCFDIGNVLIKLGKSTKEIFDIEDEEKLHFLLKNYSVGEIDRLDFLMKLKSIIRGSDLSIDEIERIFINERIKGVNEGVFDLIKELEIKKVKLAIISNTNDLHWAFLKKILPINSFEEIILSYICKIEKPNIRIYQILEERTGFKNDEIIFFDDNVENMQAALSLGWNANVVPLGDPVNFMREVLQENSLL